MPDYKLIRADEITVYDSARKPIKVTKGGIITTTDVALMRNLASDPRFAIVDPVPVETKLTTPEVVERFTSTPPPGTKK